jgi:hypothetical protein
MLDSLKQEYHYEELEIEDQVNFDEAISDYLLMIIINGNHRNHVFFAKTISFITVAFERSKC